MSLDVYLYRTEKHTCSACGHEKLVNARVCVYAANVTHNLNRMADAAGIYLPLWRPEEMTPPAKFPIRAARERIAAAIARPPP